MRAGAAAALAVVTVTISAWLVLASVLFLWVFGYLDLYPWPGRAWMWARYANEAWGHPIVHRWLIITGIMAAVPFSAIAVLILRLWWRRPRHLVPPPGGGLRPLEAGVTNNHGHAAFATPEQVATRFSGPGCLIGAADRSVDARLLFDDINAGPGHSMIFAGPGSHKTTSAVTRVWHWDGPRVVFDPSCEIGPIMTDALQARRCNVYTIGLKGSGLDALDWIDVKHPEADAHIRSAVDWIYNEGATHRSGGDQNHDPFWGTWGRALVTCLAAHMLHHPAPLAPKTLRYLRRGIATPESEMPALLEGIYTGSTSRMACDLAGGLKGMKAEKTFSSIYANAFAATEWLSVGAYADVVSGNAMPTSAILNSRTVVFIQLPLRTLLATPAVGRAVMGALFNAMFHADGDGIEDRILFELDEAWILGRLKEIMLCHTTARKYRGCVQTLWQSEAQVEDVWGREGAKTMRDTLSWRSYNAVQDGDIAERLSRDLGEHAVLAYSEGDNQGQQKPWGIALPSSSASSNTNVHEIKRRLIKADEIMRAQADEMFVLARDFPQPIRCVSAPYFRYPDIADRMNSNRFAKVAGE